MQTTETPMDHALRVLESTSLEEVETALANAEELVKRYRAWRSILKASGRGKKRSVKLPPDGTSRRRPRLAETANAEGGTP